MENEIWKDIKGYEGLYQVSNLGRIKSLERKSKTKGNVEYIKKEKVLKERFSHGYVSVILYKNGTKKNFRVHRLVAKAFLVNPKNLPQINHINFNRSDNRIENLEWVTAKENIQHNFKNGNVEKIIKNAKSVGKRYGGNKNVTTKAKLRLSKKVYQIDKNTGQIIKVWDSAKDVERILKIPNTNISRCCLKKCMTAGGYIWKH